MGLRDPAGSWRAIAGSSLKPQHRRAGAYLYCAIDQLGQVIDVLVAKKRDLVAHPPVCHPCSVNGFGITASAAMRTTYNRGPDQFVCVAPACAATRQYAGMES